MLAVLLTAPLPALLNNLYSFELANGLKVFLVPDPGAEYTSLLVYHLSGARDEPADLSGAAYLYQYLIFHKTENLEAGDHFFIMSKTSGMMTTRVNFDYSAFFKIVPDAEINTALWLESERLYSLQLDNQFLNRQKTAYNNRISRMEKTSVDYRAYNWVQSTVLQGTAYEAKLQGQPDTLIRADNGRLLNFYDNYRDPARIILVINGRFSIDELKTMINRHFQKLAARPRVRPAPFFPAEPRREVIFQNWIEPNLAEHFTIYGFRFPARISHDEVYTEFLYYYLMDERVGKLKAVLNQANQVDVAVSCDLTDFFEANTFTLQLRTPQRAELEKAKYVLNRELESLQNQALNNQDLRAIKTLMELDYLKKLSRPEERSYLIAETFHRYRDLGQVDGHLKRIQRITSFDIQRAARKYLARENQVILNVYAEK